MSVTRTQNKQFVFRVRGPFLHIHLYLNEKCQAQLTFWGQPFFSKHNIAPHQAKCRPRQPSALLRYKAPLRFVHQSVPINNFELQKELKMMKNMLVGFPEFVRNTIDKEFDSEIGIYLGKK